MPRQLKITSWTDGMYLWSGPAIAAVRWAIIHVGVDVEVNGCCGRRIENAYVAYRRNWKDDVKFIAGCPQTDSVYNYSFGND